MLFVQPTVRRIGVEGLKQGKAPGLQAGATWTTAGASWGHLA